MRFSFKKAVGLCCWILTLVSYMSWHNSSKDAFSATKVEKEVHQEIVNKIVQQSTKDVHQDIKKESYHQMKSKIYKNSTYNTLLSDEQEWEAIQQQRTRTLDAKCNTLYGFNPSNSTDPDRSEMRGGVFDRKNKVFFCNIPKVANTYIKVLMALQTGGTKEKIKNMISAHEQKWHSVHFALMPKFGLHTRKYYSAKPMVHMLETYSNLLFVRDPFERILSCYRDKFEGEQRDTLYRKLANQIVKLYRKNDTVPQNMDMTFGEFVKYLIEYVPNNRVNSHWQRYTSICHPCKIRYKVIGKLDTMREDIARVFPQSTINDMEYLVKTIGGQPSNRSSASHYNEHYSKVPKSDLQKLYEVYKADFELFGFEPQFEF